MDLASILFILYILFFNIGCSVCLLVLLVVDYPIEPCLERISIFVFIILILRIDKCITFVSIYFKKSGFEFEATIIGSLIFLLNSVESDCTTSQQSFLSYFSKGFFYGVICLNWLAYAYSLVLIFAFAVMILVLVLRGGQNNMGINLDSRALNPDQMASLEAKMYRDLKEEMGVFSNQNNQNNQNIQKEPNLQNNNSNLQINIDNRQSSNDNQKVCSICLSEFLDDEMVCKLPECNHVFHKDCIQKWLERNHICPFCRNDIKRAIRRKKRALAQRN